MESWVETNKKNSLGSKAKKYAPMTILVFTLVMLSVIMGKYTSVQFLNSDAASELVLGKILSEEGGILTKSWYYSTELRVFNTQLIWKFLFEFTNNWQVVRVLGSIILYGILLASYIYMCNKVKIDKKLTYLSAALIFLPISNTYFSVILEVPYYIPHIMITFLSLGMIINFVELKDQKNKKIINIIIMMILAFLAGLGGLRLLLNCYIPLVCATIILFIQENVLEKRKNPYNNIDIRKFVDEKKWIIIASAALMFSLIGYIINSKILSKNYSFANYGKISFINFKFENLEKVINSWLIALGYETGNVFSISLVVNLMVFCMVLIAIVQCYYLIRKPEIYSKNQRLLCWFVFFAFLTQSVVGIITNIDYTNRYVLPISIFIFPSMCIFYQNAQQNKKLSRKVAILLFALIFLTSAARLVKYKDSDRTVGKRDAVDFLVANGYSEGFSTYWNGNVLTELSDGALDMYVWSGAIENITDIEKMFEWLQKVEHSYTKPQTAPFIILNQSEYAKWELGKRIDPSYLIYQSSEYIIFAYPDYATMQNDFIE